MIMQSPVYDYAKSRIHYVKSSLITTKVQNTLCKVQKSAGHLVSLRAGLPPLPLRLFNGLRGAVENPSRRT